MIGLRLVVLEDMLSTLVFDDRGECRSRNGREKQKMRLDANLKESFHCVCKTFIATLLLLFTDHRYFSARSTVQLMLHSEAVDTVIRTQQMSPNRFT